MSILDKAPLYALRKYDNIYTEDQYTLITTYYATYILDMPSLDGNYYARRLALMCMELPYKLYALKERFTTIPQLINTTRTMLIDSDGRVFKYKKSRWLKVEYTKVLSNDQTHKGKYRISTKLSDCFISDTPAAYIGYIIDGHSILLYEICTELKKTRRVKI
jgi:hypothetical protein